MVATARIRSRGYLGARGEYTFQCVCVRASANGKKEEQTVTVWLQDTMFTSWGRQNTYSRWDTGAVFIGARGARNGHAGGRCRQRDARRPKNLLASCADQQRLDTAHLVLFLHLADPWRQLPATRHARDHFAPTLRPPQPRSETKTHRTWNGKPSP